MNGLEALERIKSNSTTEVATLAGYVGEPVHYAYKKEFAIIKKELKDGEKYKKVLEILKRTALRLVSLEDETTICKKGRYAFYDGELYGSVDLTKEEYDLLKEVLKYE